MKIPSAHQVVKCAGMAELSTAAAVGMLLSHAASIIPGVAQLRTSNPALYDAAIAAGTLQVLTAMEETEIPHDASFHPMSAV